MRFLLGLALALVATSAWAGCERLVRSDKDHSAVYKCDVPTLPPPAPAAPKCQFLHGHLFCTGDITETPPSNCKHVKDKYVCS
jgi:hypothetical protein